MQRDRRRGAGDGAGRAGDVTPLQMVEEQREYWLQEAEDTKAKYGGTDAWTPAMQCLHAQYWHTFVVLRSLSKDMRAAYEQAAQQRAERRWWKRWLA